MSSSALVTAASFDPSSPPLPLVLSPAVEADGSSVDVDLVAWARHHRGWIDELLLAHRALLFRGFAVGSAERFAAFVDATAVGGAMEAPGDESTPRERAGAPLVYRSTLYPRHERIGMHNEAAYCRVWPRKLYFYCQIPPAAGGETPLADGRRVLARLPAALVDEFDRRGVTYVRNFHKAIGLSWQQAFYTADRGVLEGYCRAHDIAATWGEDGCLHTRACRPALRRHPATSERLWFNHAAFFHPAGSTPEVERALLESYGRGRLPHDTEFGDGGEIPRAHVAQIAAAYAAERVLFPWHRDDVLLLDNMTVAHGREPFFGERRVLVALAEPERGD